MTARRVSIDGRRIGAGEPPYVIAEAGVNHNGDPALAERLVDAAADAGADAVKFQTFTADRLALGTAPQAPYQRERAAAGSQLEMLRGLELSIDAHAALREQAVRRGLAFLSSPFDVESVEMLAQLGVPAFKIGSGDLTNLFLLRAVAGRGLPVLLSTGMSGPDEVDQAVADLRAHGDPPLILLQCVSAYPADPATVNLRVMETLAERYDVDVGFSDHTTGIGAAAAAAALGATVIEKHLTLDRSLPGPDHAASLDPVTFTAMVTAIREAHAALGDGAKRAIDAEIPIRAVARRSIVVARDIRAAAVLTEDDLTALRPEGGISPLRLDEVVGRAAARDLTAGTLLEPSDLVPALSEPPRGAADQPG